MQTASTISPVIPAAGADLSASAIRAQFLAAINDLDALFLSIAGATSVVEFFPGLTFGGNAIGLTGVFEGHVRSWGGEATIEAVLTVTVKGSSSGQIAITGFPAPLRATGIRLSVGPYTGFGNGDISAVLTGDTVTLLNGPPNGISQPLTDLDVAGPNQSAFLTISGSYLTA